MLCLEKNREYGKQAFGQHCRDTVSLRRDIAVESGNISVLESGNISVLGRYISSQGG